MDHKHTFDEVLFYGSECLLVQFELMLFAVSICLFENFLASVVVVGITYQVRYLIIIVTNLANHFISNS